MSTSTQQALNAYQAVGIQTRVPHASPVQLVVMLHEGAISAIRSARLHLQARDIGAKGQAISKAISIIDGGLRASLDPQVGGALAGNMLELYRYMSSRLLEANTRNDPAAMDQVVELLLQLKSAWEVLASKPDASRSMADQGQELDSSLARKGTDFRDRRVAAYAGA